ncbi:MAG: pilus assembly FimT family protein, partial [Candidatus Rokuibacteriota bacterium]
MSARGFALVELMVVLGIAGALAALVAPTLSSYARTAALQAAARELAASINLGRQIAISRNTTVCVEL